MNAHTANDYAYSTRTRLFHGALALTVLMQLLTSLVMQGPGRQGPGDWLFEIHEYSGLVALTLATGFFIHIFTRRSGTAVGALLPWFEHGRRRALLADVCRHGRQLRMRRIPDYSVDSPLASAVHGLGLTLILGMAVTGAVFFAGLYLGEQSSGLFPLDLEVHKFLACLVWAYLVGHAGLAILHHWLKQSPLQRMWSLQ